MGNGWATGVHPEDIQRHVTIYVSAFARPDGELRFLRSVTDGIRNEKGELVTLVGATQDITDVRRSQEQAFARQKLETVGTLANGIAHDFNNLLGGVLTQAELALAELAAGSHPKQELKTICGAAMRGSEIVRELMIYAGHEKESLGLADISSIIEEMLELMKVSVFQTSNHRA
jgi:C4-dicarboxylate-specific signal transduction histidine kinase